MKKNTKDYFFVSIQFLLFVAYTFDFFKQIAIPKFLVNVGLVIALIGLAIAVLTVFELKANLSVFPSPTKNAVLITHGFFRYSRHPIYSGIILFSFGYACYKYSLYKLIISGLLLSWFYLKSIYEEQQLMNFFPTYQTYKKVTGRFFPKIKFINA